MRRSDGAAAVWVLVAVCILGAATAVGLATGAIVAVRHRAAAAADAAALAGAIDGGLTPTSACAAARLVAAADGARLVRCTVADAVVSVRTAVSPPRWLGWVPAATARACAGPAAFSRGLPLRPDSP